MAASPSTIRIVCGHGIVGLSPSDERIGIRSRHTNAGYRSNVTKFGRDCSKLVQSPLSEGHDRVPPRHHRAESPDQNAAPRASGGVRAAPGRAGPAGGRPARCCCWRPKPPARKASRSSSSLGTAPPVILFAPVRGAAVLRRPADGDAAVVAAILPEALANPDALRGLADPTARTAGHRRDDCRPPLRRGRRRHRPRQTGPAAAGRACRAPGVGRRTSRIAR